MDEFSFIKYIYSHFDSISKNAYGDDAAFIKIAPDRYLAITKDVLVEDVHFSLKLSDARSVGRKALACNLSDLAACTAKPLYFLLGISFPHGKKKAVNEIVKGMSEYADMSDIKLIGGDTTASTKNIFISITAVGSVNKPAMRGTARFDDYVYLTDYTGYSSLGLHFLKTKLAVPNKKIMRIIKKCKNIHQVPVPPVEISQYLSKKYTISSMIDISDGLSSELYHLKEMNKKKHIGFAIDYQALFSPELVTLQKYIKRNRAEKRFNIDKYVLHGGEDYVLLFTSPDNIKMKNIIHIGTVTYENSICITKDKTSKTLKREGFDHFKNGKYV
ncbi:thiamine-phosphate kinase [Spirochaetota bacterium]